MEEIRLRWTGPTKWHVDMFGPSGRTIMLTKGVDCWTFISQDDRPPWKIPWPGDPTTVADCLAMAERVWAEQFGSDQTVAGEK